LEGLELEDVGIFYGHLEYILWPVGIFYGRLVIFPRFGTLHKEKSGNPGPNQLHILCWNIIP
jgi:hypothetical protein